MSTRRDMVLQGEPARGNAPACCRPLAERFATATRIWPSTEPILKHLRVGQNLQEAHGRQPGRHQRAPGRDRRFAGAERGRQDHQFLHDRGFGATKRRPDRSSTGNDVTKLPMFRRARLGMGYLPQEESIFRKLTVEQNLLAILETLQTQPQASATRVATSCSSSSALRTSKKNQALTLSGGEKRRLTIARSLITSPSLLMLDEPFSGVDPIAVTEVQQIILSLRENCQPGDYHHGPQRPGDFDDCGSRLPAFRRQGRARRHQGFSHQRSRLAVSFIWENDFRCNPWVRFREVRDCFPGAAQFFLLSSRSIEQRTSVMQIANSEPACHGHRASPRHHCHAQRLRSEEDRKHLHLDYPQDHRSARHPGSRQIPAPRRGGADLRQPHHH